MRSASGQKQTLDRAWGMSALPQKRTWPAPASMSAKCHKQTLASASNSVVPTCLRWLLARACSWRQSNVKPSVDPRAARAPVIAHPAHAMAPAGERVAIGLPLHPARPLLAELTARDPPFAAVGCAVAACKSCCHRTHPARHAATRGIADGKLESGNFKIDGLAAHCFAELVT